MTTSPTLRPAAQSDAVVIAEIYAHYVLNTTSTFEINPPDEAEIGRRMTDTVGGGLPYVVAEVDGVVVGYAYAVLYRPRPAYRFTVEDSIYIHPRHTGRGLGRLLLTDLIESCTSVGYRQMVAVIGGSDNAASIGLHASLGFEPAGLLRSVGFKFDGWLDSVLMQRALRNGPGLSELADLKQKP